MISYKESIEQKSIYNGGCTENPNICFVFMNPTGRNIASFKEWKGINSHGFRQKIFVEKIM